MAIAVVGEPVIGGRKFLETLTSNAGEITGEFRILSEDHGASRHESIDQRLLPHWLSERNTNPLTEHRSRLSKKR